MAPTFQHTTVLLDETLAQIAPHPGGIYVDVTLGGGGHAEALLERSAPDGKLIGIDRDPVARAAARERLERFGDRVRIADATMADVRAVVAAEGAPLVDGLIADLGVSSPQIDDASRGMSFRTEGPLDMRMDPTRGVRAWDLVRNLRERDLADVIYLNGDERASRPIARSIKRAIESGEMETTTDLARSVYRVLGPPRPGRGIDPATRTFQALRIAVNDELAQIDALLAALPDVLADDGVAVVISFHSLEDRRVKHAFRGAEALEVLTRKPVEAGENECRDNPRARSAKLRAARRRHRADFAMQDSRGVRS